MSLLSSYVGAYTYRASVRARRAKVRSTTIGFFACRRAEQVTVIGAVRNVATLKINRSRRPPGRRYINTAKRLKRPSTGRPDGTVRGSYRSPRPHRPAAAAAPDGTVRRAVAGARSSHLHDPSVRRTRYREPQTVDVARAVVQSEQSRDRLYRVPTPTDASAAAPPYKRERERESRWSCTSVHTPICGGYASAIQSVLSPIGSRRAL